MLKTIAESILQYRHNPLGCLAPGDVVISCGMRSAMQLDDFSNLIADPHKLNERVYALFDLTPAEIKLIEDSTRYRYGEV